MSRRSIIRFRVLGSHQREICCHAVPAEILRVPARDTLNVLQLNQTLSIHISDDVNDLSPITPAMFLQEIETSDLTDIDHEEINKKIKPSENSLGKDFELRSTKRANTRNQDP
ncbi:hypothetical protein TNIN_155341 [Trichonephila inaurata madagascariensis]|uniref:Uncharacterized protein n=1 Tax=Trichonephila inaurata madagascariensis TaxID=2747483 RepID=A0A8X6YY86_9ARAC|nr:hypothetical protein TNIN_155341 [Trichonephila inaurata madagascariensis]